MDRSRYHRLRELFVEVASAAPAQRAARLEALVAEDPSLRPELEALLRIDDGRSPALRPETASERSRLALLERLDGMDGGLLDPPARIGRYRVLRPIGRGGMGCVYEAEQDAPRRTVALKVVHPALATPHLLRRFEFEAAVLARLHHPGIARIYEAGTAGRGAQRRPWFAMELVDGVPITTYAERFNLDRRARLELVARVCDAVHHAHQKGVVHRDLKPSNILVEPDTDGGPGRPKVLDFGVARATDVDVRNTTMRTDLGQLVGTIPYMSPEQAIGDSAGIDTRSDVYALGVIAYRLLAGRLPCGLDERPVPDALRAIRDEEAPRLGTLDRTLRGDVETIVAKALEKDPQRRYDSAAALAADIRRHLTDEPIEARPPSAVYQLRKFARRHRPLLTAVSAAILLLLFGATGTTWGMVWALDESDRAGEALTLAANRLTDLEKAREEAQCQAELAEERLVEAEEGYRDAEDVLGFLDSVMATGASGHLGVPQDIRELMLAVSETARDSSLPPLTKARILQSTGRVFSRIGLVNAATADLQESLAIYESYLPDCDPRLRSTRQSLATLALKSMDFGAYEKLHQSVWGCLGTSSLVDTYAVESNWISYLTQRKMHDESLGLMKDLFGRCVREFGTDDWNTASALGSLAAISYRQGSPAEAVAYAVTALPVLRKYDGPGAEFSIACSFTLARGLMDLGSESADGLYWDIIRDARATIGTAHPHVLAVRHDIARRLQDQRPEEAMVLFEDLLLDCELVLGSSHPRTIRTAEILDNVKARVKKNSTAHLDGAAHSIRR